MIKGMTSESIKLVIWDMDDTFWTGTLSEENISLVDRNIEIVKTLVDRGIMSSISSKNDFDKVKQVLVKAGIWDLFVFPQISWNAKGGAIATIIDQANLRPDNILFIDDNALNIEEIRFAFPAMQVSHPDDVLPVLLDLPQVKGKDDRAHSRLEQYKRLEQKVADQTQTTLSNAEFLRQCDIKLRFEFDVDSHFDRIVELINRSNQLNFTKVRLEDEKAIAAFREDLKQHDILSAAIFASDRYGDHGLIGFYMQLNKGVVNKLLHFVWSCRMMNAGLEQYVYERIGRPDIKVVEPVSNPIVTFDTVDWVREVKAGDLADAAADAALDPKLMLLGSCDLLVMASYCSRNRVEYVNGVRNGVMVRYDDFGFILNDPARIAASEALDRVPAWTRAEFDAFHADVAASDVLILSLAAAMKGAYLLTGDQVALRAHPDAEGLGNYIDVHPWAGFLKGCKFFALDIDQRIDLLTRSLERVHASAGAGKQKFLLGANTRDPGGQMSRANFDLMTRYNATCEAFCRTHPNWHFVSIDEVVALDKLMDDRHFTRMAYFDIAQYINRHIGLPADASAPAVTTAPETVDLARLIGTGRELSRISLLGSAQGPVAQVKRAVKLTPLSALRKALKKPRAGQAAHG